MHPNVASVKYFLHAETLFLYLSLSKLVTGMRLEVFLSELIELDRSEISAPILLLLRYVPFIRMTKFSDPCLRSAKKPCEICFSRRKHRRSVNKP